MTFREQLIHQLQCQGANTELAATELADAYRAEVLAEAAALATPAPPEVSFFGDYGPQVAWWLRMLVGGQERATGGTAPAAPDFFEAGRTYTRPHHGETITFVVHAVSTSPDGRTTVAHGWRITPYTGGSWEVADSDDFTGWTDATEVSAS